jgi:hypothetical protein
MILNLLPTLCFAFFFESMLIPVSNAFVMKDENGAIGMRSSIISLFLSFIIYSLIVPIMHVIKDNYGDKSNLLVYLTVFQIFDKVFAITTLLIMAILAVLQAISFFQLALE